MENYWACEGCSARFAHGAAIQYRVCFAQGVDRSIHLHAIECFDPNLGGVQAVPGHNLRLPDLAQRHRELLAQGVIVGPLWYCESCLNRLFGTV